MEKLSLETAKRLMLGAQGLLKKHQKKVNKSDVLKKIKQMGQLQIDTINVVARSPYLVLWSRLGSYKKTWLDELLEEREIFEYWSHAMCFLPIEDFPLYRRLALSAKGRGTRTERWFKKNIKTVELVLDHIKKNGETKSSDFLRTDGQKGAWWNWKAEKIALEVLFDRGNLMITRRKNFHRIYDLRERVFPSWSDSKAPPYKEVQKILAIKAIKALGVSTKEWISDYFYTPKRELPEVLQNLVDEKEIYLVEIENLGKAYIHKEATSLGLPKPTLTTLLSPFDPLINYRRRAKEVFDFNYQIECYTPAAKRKYGYFSLPILYRGKLIGRLDPKAHRKEGLMEIKSIHLEPNVKITDELISETAGIIKKFASWHQTPEIKILKSNPKELKKYLLKLLH